ncbi:hypothetical protein [Saccharopolyspora shandongensis]|uniref:hypothetical protein n=1 Tax=Saccharopolyspora shandongensis TaxID=418495 RepID=UPI0033D4F322
MQLDSFEGSDHPFAAEVHRIIRNHDRSRPRSRQVLIGPSEVGEPCARRLAYRLMRERRQPSDYDPWPSIVGTSIHEHMAQVFAAENERLGRIRYLIEKSVDVRPGMPGTCDLYDADRKMVVDWKNVSANSLRKYRENGPGDKYRTQAHLYARGFTQLGLPVEAVAIVFFSRSGGLGQMHMWHEPYNGELVDKALDRIDTVLELASALNVDSHPENYEQIPKAPSFLCRYCPWFRENGTGSTCNGKED